MQTIDEMIDVFESEEPFENVIKRVAKRNKLWNKIHVSEITDKMKKFYVSKEEISNETKATYKGNVLSSEFIDIKNERYAIKKNSDIKNDGAIINLTIDSKLYGLKTNIDVVTFDNKDVSIYAITMDCNNSFSPSIEWEKECFPMQKPLENLKDTRYNRLKLKLSIQASLFNKVYPNYEIKNLGIIDIESEKEDDLTVFGNMVPKEDHDGAVIERINVIKIDKMKNETKVLMDYNKARQ